MAMVKDLEVLNDLQELRKKTESLADPFRNDFAGSDFWGDIHEQLGKIEEEIKKNFKLWAIS